MVSGNGQLSWIQAMLWVWFSTHGCMCCRRGPKHDIMRDDEPWRGGALEGGNYVPEDFVLRKDLCSSGTFKLSQYWVVLRGSSACASLSGFLCRYLISFTPNILLLWLHRPQAFIRGQTYVAASSLTFSIQDHESNKPLYFIMLTCLRYFVIVKKNENTAAKPYIFSVYQNLGWNNYLRYTCVSCFLQRVSLISYSLKSWNSVRMTMHKKMKSI